MNMIPISVMIPTHQRVVVLCLLTSLCTCAAVSINFKLLMPFALPQAGGEAGGAKQPAEQRLVCRGTKNQMLGQHAKRADATGGHWTDRFAED
jgi:hypothetical protein